MNKKCGGVLSILLAFIMTFAMVVPSVTLQGFTADPGGGSEGTVGYFHPKQGDVKYVFPAAQGSNIPGPYASWLGGVEPESNKQYVYCINPSKNALDKESWNQHFRWRYNLNVNRWILTNNNAQLTNPLSGFDADDMYSKLQKALYLGYPYKYNGGNYSYKDTQDAVQHLITGSWEIGHDGQNARALVDAVNSFSETISGGLYFYAPDTDTKQNAQNTVGLTLWNYPDEQPEDPIPDDPTPTPATATVGVSAKKTVNGDFKAASEWSNRQFAFKLEGEGKAEAMLDGVTEEQYDRDGIKFVHTRWLGQDKVTDANGLIPKHDEVFFGEISFKEVGTYKFKVYELDPNIKDASQQNAAVDGRGRPLTNYDAVDGMSYDHTYYDLEFEVTKVGDSLVVKQNDQDVTGKMVSVDNTGTAIQFTNKYTEPPTLKTTVKCDGKEGSETGPAEIVIGGNSAEKEVTDKIDYSKLQGGYTYKVQGTLVEVNGSNVTTVKISDPVELKADDSGSGTWTISFGSVKLEVGKKYVVYEEATPVKDADGNVITDGETIEHKNPEDDKQTIVVSKNPIEVTTQVKNQYISPAKNQSITDDVTLKGLENGKTYTIKGVIKNKKDGSDVDAVCIPLEVDSSSGVCGVQFIGIDASGFKDGDKLVVFEYLYEGSEQETENFTPGDGNEVASHTDINDAAQTATIVDGQIKLEKTTDVSSVRPGDVIPYTITVTNERRVPVTVQIVDTPDAGLKYIEASDDGEYDSEVGTIVWDNLEVPANGSVSVSAFFVIEENASGKLTNRAHVFEPDNPENVLGVYEDAEDVKVLGAYEDSDNNGNKKVKGANTGDDAPLGAALIAFLAAAGAFELIRRRRTN